MIILGLNYAFHDSSACVVVDGKLVAAIEEERVEGDKHSQKFPESSIRRCLDIAGVHVSDIDHIAVSINPLRGVWKKAFYAARLGRSAGPFLSYEFLRPLYRHVAFRSWYSKTWSGSKKTP